jgi:hypothetical protein
MVNIQFDRFLRLLDKARRVEMTKNGDGRVTFYCISWTSGSSHFQGEVGWGLECLVAEWQSGRVAEIFQW